MPRRHWNSLLDLLMYSSTETLEAWVGIGTAFRGIWALTHQDTVFVGVAGMVLEGIMPPWVWGLTGLLPGVLQILAVASRRMDYRRLASVANVGVLVLMAGIFLTHNPGAMLTAVYLVASSSQIYISARLLYGPEPPRRRYDDDARHPQP